MLLYPCLGLIPRSQPNLSREWFTSFLFSGPKRRHMCEINVFTSANFPLSPFFSYLKQKKYINVQCIHKYKHYKKNVCHKKKLKTTKKIICFPKLEKSKMWIHILIYKKICCKLLYVCICRSGF